MSRISTNEPIQISATNNIYTVLVAAAVVIELVALIVLIMAHKDLYTKFPWG